MKLLMVTNQQNFHNSTKGNMYSYVPVDFYKIEDRLSTCIQLAWLNKN